MSDHRTSFPHHVDVAKHMALCRGRPIWYLLCRSDAFQSFVQSLWLDSLFPVVRVPVGTSTTETTTADGDGGVVRSRGGGGVPRNLSVPAVATPLDDENETMTMYVAGEPCVPSSMTMMMASHDGRKIAPSSSFRPSSPSSRRGGSSVNYAQDPRDISTQREISSSAGGGGSAGGMLAASTMIASTTGNSSSIFPLSSSAAAASPHDIPTSAAFPKMMNGKRETILKGFRALVESHERRSANTTRMMAGGGGSGGGGGGGGSITSNATASQFPARVGATQPFVQDPNYQHHHQSHGGGRNGPSPSSSLSTAATLFRPSSAGGRGVGVLSGSAVVGGATGKNSLISLNPPPPRIPSTNILRNEIHLARQQQQQQQSPSLETEASDAPSPTKSVVSDDDNIQRQARPNDWMLETPVLARYRLWIATSRARSQVDRITEILSAIASAMCHQGPVDTMQSLLETVVQHPVEKYRLASEQEQNASLVRKGATAATASAAQASSSTPKTANTVDIANGDPATTINENGRAPEQMKDVDHDNTENKGEEGGDDEGGEGDDIDGGEWYQRTHEAFYLSSQVALLELRVFGYLPTPSPLSKTAGHHASGQRHQSGGNAFHHLEDHSLLSNPSDLLRTRLDMRKRAPLDPAIQIELLLRRADIKQALALWWHWLPKHSLRRDGGSNGNERKGSDRDSEAISRNVFVQIAIHVHCALAGGSLPLASPSTLEALRRLCYEDWPYLFMSYQQLQRVTHDELHTPSKSVGGSSGHGHNGHGGGVSVSVSSQFRALLAKGVECPLSFNRSLFDVAMLLLLEPWMETSAPEERLLALSMLFQKTFERKKMRRAADHNKHENVIGAAATSDTDDETDLRGGNARSFSWSLYYYRLRGLPTFLPNNADGVVLSRPASSAATRPYHLISGGGGGSTTNSPSRGGARPSSPGAAAFSQKVAPVRELVEQLDAAADKNLGLKQALRNKAELSDVSVELTKDAWRSEVLRLNLRKARSRGTTFALPTEVSSSTAAADGSIHDTVPFTELELKKTFAPHDASRSFGLERVLLQRLTKRVADCSAAALVLHRQQDFDSKFAKSAGHDSNEVLQMLPNTSATLHRPGSPFRPAGGSGGGGPQQNITTTDEATLKAAVKATQQANIVVHATKHLIPPEYLHQIARYHRSAVEAFRDQVKTATIVLCQGGGGSGATAGARADDDNDGTMFDGDDALLLDVNTLADMLAPPPRRGFEKPLIAASMTPEEAMEEKMSRSSACFVRRPASAQGYTQHTNHDDGAGQDEGDGAGILNGVSESLRRPLSALLGRTAPHGLRDTRPRHLATHPKPTSRPLSAAQIKQQQQQQPTTLYISPYMKVGALPVTGGSAFSSKKQHQHHRPSSAAR